MATMSLEDIDRLRIIVDENKQLDIDIEEGGTLENISNILETVATYQTVTKAECH